MATNGVFPTDFRYASAWEDAPGFVKALVSGHGADPLALAAIGHCHVAGRGVAADKATAEEYYRRVDGDALGALAEVEHITPS